MTVAVIAESVLIYGSDQFPNWSLRAHYDYVKLTVERANTVSATYPHQPPSGKMHSSSRTNDLARITHPSDKYILKNLTFVCTYHKG